MAATNYGTAYLWGIAGGEVNVESVRDAVFLSSPFDTPLLQLAPKVPAAHTTEEWLEDSLMAVNTGGKEEGRAFTATALQAPTRVTNWTQIFGKDVAISLTQMKLKSYGFKDAMAREILDGTREVLRNIESKIFGASGAATVAAASAATRLMKTIEDFVTTHAYTADATDIGGLGGGSASATAGMIEDRYNKHLQLIFNSGGNPTHLFLNGAYKRQVSGWQGSPTNTIPATNAQVDWNIPQGTSQLGRSITSYLSDFGMQTIVLDRWVPQDANVGLASVAGSSNVDKTGRAFIIDMNKFEIAFLRDVAFMPLAPAGDYVHGQITGELTIRVINESWHGLVKELNSTGSGTYS
jgi:hypothetical protein